MDNLIKLVAYNFIPNNIKSRYKLWDSNEVIDLVHKIYIFSSTFSLHFFTFLII